MRFLPALILLPAFFCASTVHAAEAPTPVKIIFDTDMGNDVDDALALAMLHSFQSRAQCELLAVTITNPQPLAGPFTDAVNTFYGRPNVPIGVTRERVPHGDDRFLKAVSQDGGRRYPTDIEKSADIPEPVALLRQILSKQQDGSVVIVQVGFSTNLAGLLASAADANSPLSGVDLVKRKVKLLSIMAGAFKEIDGNKRYLEYNITQDKRSAQRLGKDWPTPIIWSGFEIGIAAAYPSVSIVRDYRYVKHHPVAEAYVRYMPPPHDRPTWDLTSVLYAVLPDRGYFDLSKSGSVTVEGDGYTTFTEKEGGRDRYLILKKEQRDRVVEALVQLSSQPRTIGAAK